MKKSKNIRKPKDKPIFSKRLAEKRKQAGYTQETFAQAFDNRYRESGKSFFDTLQNYEIGRSLPYKKDLFNICELLGNCDPGYLLGIYDESKKSIHDISAEIGLSESAIQKLVELNQTPDGHSMTTLNLINELLTTREGHGFISSLVYLHEILFTISYEISNEYWTTDSSVEGLRSWEREAKYSILEAQEEFQRLVYDYLEARSILKGLSQLIHSIPDDYGPPPEEDQEQQEGN